MAHFLLLASERPERRCLIFHAGLLSAHQGRALGGGQVDAPPPAARSPEGTDLFSQGLKYGGGNECEVIHPVWCNCGWAVGVGVDEQGQIR